MLKAGILNPQINALLSRVRHTNTVVIADRGFPFWPQVETVDIALVDDIPTVLNVIRALLPNFKTGNIWMAEEFRQQNMPETLRQFADTLPPITWVPHVDLKQRVPSAIGLIRTGDTTRYANVILESA